MFHCHTILSFIFLALYPNYLKWSPALFFILVSFFFFFNFAAKHLIAYFVSGAALFISGHKFFLTQYRIKYVQRSHILSWSPYNYYFRLFSIQWVPIDCQQHTNTTHISSLYHFIVVVVAIRICAHCMYECHFIVYIVPHFMVVLRIFLLFFFSHLVEGHILHWHIVPAYLVSMQYLNHLNLTHTHTHTKRLNENISSNEGISVIYRRIAYIAQCHCYLNQVQ